VKYEMESGIRLFKDRINVLSSSKMVTMEVLGFTIIRGSLELSTTKKTSSTSRTISSIMVMFVHCNWLAVSGWNSSKAITDAGRISI